MESEEEMVSLAFKPEFEALPAGSATKLTFSAHLLAPEVVEEEDSARSIVSLTSVLDKSGSMGGSKLDLVKVKARAARTTWRSRLCCGHTCRQWTGEELGHGSIVVFPHLAWAFSFQQHRSHETHLRCKELGSLYIGGYERC